MAIHVLDGHRPKLPPAGEAFIAPSADVIGKVEVGRKVSIWFGAVLRGDYEFIRIGNGTNIQDNSVVHTDWGCPTTVGENVVVGHKVILHGCTIGNRVLVGMGAIVMNGAEVGDECIIGAGAVVPEGKKIPPRSLVLGVPGKVVKEVSDEQVADIIRNAEDYQKAIPRYLRGLEEA